MADLFSSPLVIHILLHTNLFYHIRLIITHFILNLLQFHLNLSIQIGHYPSYYIVVVI